MDTVPAEFAQEIFVSSSWVHQMCPRASLLTGIFGLSAINHYEQSHGKELVFLDGAVRSSCYFNFKMKPMASNATGPLLKYRRFTELVFGGFLNSDPPVKETLVSEFIENAGMGKLALYTFDLHEKWIEHLTLWKTLASVTVSVEMTEPVAKFLEGLLNLKRIIELDLIGCRGSCEDLGLKFLQQSDLRFLTLGRFHKKWKKRILGLWQEDSTRLSGKTVIWSCHVSLLNKTFERIEHTETNRLRYESKDFIVEYKKLKEKVTMSIIRFL
ncbi:hypothetical protein L596_017722 [Steinernema carpocapsae]|uniref:F-box associated domain-containing protein n=1 Tax=Steinernema carpocapsae TaxID=34508 RepID=A0A4U5N2U1_STECR|nr:hypothetical protein L596_017722 [Steinernema carpocapsae]